MIHSILAYSMLFGLALLLELGEAPASCRSGTGKF